MKVPDAWVNFKNWRRFLVEISTRRLFVCFAISEILVPMDERAANEPGVTDVPPGTTDDVIRVLVEAGLIEDVGERTPRQRWKKPLTFGLAHAIRTGAIPLPVVRTIYQEARRILKGAPPMFEAELRIVLPGRAASGGSTGSSPRACATASWRC